MEAPRPRVRLVIPERGDQDHGARVAQCVEPFEHREARDARHANVGDHQVDALAAVRP